MNSRAIPDNGTLDWQAARSVPIHARDESLVDTQTLAPKILTQSEYFRQNIQYALPSCYVRETLAQKLIQVSNSLPEGLHLLILDGWRPVELQQKLLEIIGEDVKRRFAHETPERQEALLSLFVAAPSTDPKKPSPHLTGASVDLTLCTADGVWLDMGSDFDAPIDESWTDAFESLDNLEARKNRRILYWAMIDAGFSNLPSEWWHFDYGNQLWAHHTGHDHAFFGMTSL